MITQGLKLNAKVREMWALPEIQDITDQLPKHPSKVWPRRSLDSIKLIVQHHTASEAPLINQANYHINHHHWAGLAYTFVVDRGNIYQTNDLLSLTSHALGTNPFAVGVCVNGDLSKRPLTDFERKALTAIHFTLGEIIPGIEIMGHNEASFRYADHRTSCPCTDMNRLREDVSTLELKMAVTDTANDQLAKAVALRARVEDLYRTASVPGKYQAEAQRKLAIVAEMMKEQGLL